MLDYYKDAHEETEITDEDQPIILVRKKGPQNEEKNLYFIPELCSLSGLEDSDVKDGYFMRDLAKKTKLEPNDRVFKTNQFLELFKNDERKKIIDKKDKEKPPIELPSSKEKSDLYGIEIKPLNKLYTAYYMKETKIIAGNNKKLTPKDKVFPVLQKEDMTYWICLYEKRNYDNADNLYKTLKSASKGFGLKIEEPEWIEMSNNSKAKVWASKAEEYIGKGKKDYSFAVFLIGDDDELYTKLKIHSLCTNGYISQIIKSRTVKKKGLMIIRTKILFKLNDKIGGAYYKI